MTPATTFLNWFITHTPARDQDNIILMAVPWFLSKNVQAALLRLTADLDNIAWSHDTQWTINIVTGSQAGQEHTAHVKSESHFRYVYEAS